MRAPLLCLPLLLAAPAAAAPPAVHWDRQFRAIRDAKGGTWYSQATNASGTLAWGQSYVMMALVSHYVGTGDLASLDLLVRHGERLWKVRDDTRGVVDAYRKRAVAGWSASKYSRGKPYVWAVHTGMIVYPLAELCALVDERPALRQRYGATAARWRKRILEAVKVFDPQWRDGPAKGEGHYVGLSLGGRRLPFNQMNALGRALLAISRWRKPPAWARTRGVKLLQHFKRRLTYDRTRDCYDWAYAARRGRGEDISHAAINVDFAAQGARLSLVFDATDMRRFARTLLRVVKRGDRFASNVSGKGALDRYAAQVPRWLALSRWDPDVFTTVTRWLKRRAKQGKLAANLTHLLGAALVLRHRPWV